MSADTKPSDLSNESNQGDQLGFDGFEVPVEPTPHSKRDNRWRPPTPTPPRQLHLGEEEAPDPDLLDSAMLEEAREVLEERDLSNMHEMFSRRTGSPRRAHDQLIMDEARRQVEAEWEQFKNEHGFPTDAEVVATVRAGALEDIAFWQLIGMWGQIESSLPLSPEDVASIRLIMTRIADKHPDPSSSDGFTVYGTEEARLWDQTHTDPKRKRRR